MVWHLTAVVKCSCDDGQWLVTRRQLVSTYILAFLLGLDLTTFIWSETIYVCTC